VSAPEIHHQQVEICGEDVMSWHGAVKWCIQFQTERALENCKKSGKHTTTNTECITTLTKNVISSQVHYRL
jgi:hypothetical protein